MTETRECIQPISRWTISPVPGKFIKQYSTGANVFMHFQAPDGRRVDVKVRDGKDGSMLLGRLEARAVAMRKLGITVPCPLGCGGQVVPGIVIDGCPK